MIKVTPKLPKFPHTIKVAPKGGIGAFGVLGAPNWWTSNWQLTLNAVNLSDIFFILFQLLYLSL